MVKVTNAPLVQGDMVEVTIVGVMGEPDDLVSANALDKGVGECGLARSRASGNADRNRAHCPPW